MIRDWNKLEVYLCTVYGCDDWDNDVDDDDDDRRGWDVGVLNVPSGLHRERNLRISTSTSISQYLYSNNQKSTALTV